MSAKADRPLNRIGAVYRTFGPYLRPYRWRGLLAYAALLASVLMTLLKPWPLKLILDSVILHKRSMSESVPLIPEWVDRMDPYALVAALCVSLVVIVVFESLFGFFQKILFSAVGQSASTDVLESVFTHLQTLPRQTGEAARSGDVILRLTSDIKTMRDLLVNHVQKLGSYGMTFLSTVAVMAWMNWQLTLLGLAVVPVIFWTSYRFSSRIRDATREKRSREGAVASIVQESLHAVAVVQAYAQEEEERKRFRKEARESLDAGLESARLGGAFSRSVKVLSTVGTALVIWSGATRVLQGTMTPGDLIVFAAYLTELYLPIQNVAELAVQFLESLVSGERVLELIQTAPRIKDSPHAVKARAFRGEIAFEDVTFGYEKGRSVLNGLSFRALPGQTVALVGGSGAGKSTIVSLLLRFHDPWSGRVTIDGQDIRQFKLASLRRQISVVLQEPVFFRRTVRENIAYGKPGATLDEVVAAAKAAEADEFIRELPGGYSAVVEEHGSNLSGGQRQRLSLARAFLHGAPILILDEPTTGLDVATEAQLTGTLQHLAAGKTTLIIAHRLSTIEAANLILVLEDGRIVESGTHAELLEKSSRYRYLFDTQRKQDATEATVQRG